MFLGKLTAKKYVYTIDLADDGWPFSLPAQAHDIGLLTGLQRTCIGLQFPKTPKHYNSLQLPTVRTHTTTNTLPCFNVSNPTVLSCQLLLPLVTHAMPFTSHVPIWIIMSLASQWANCLISAMWLKLGLQFIDFKPTTVKPCLCWTLHVTMLPILSECSWCLRAALLARGNCTCTTLCRHSFAVVSSLAYKPHTIVCHI